MIASRASATFGFHLMGGGRDDRRLWVSATSDKDQRGFRPHQPSRGGHYWTRGTGEMLARANVELLAAGCSDWRPRKATAETGVVTKNPLTGKKARPPHWPPVSPPSSSQRQHHTCRKRRNCLSLPEARAEAHNRIPVAPRCDREDLGMARDGDSDAREKTDVRADIGALEEMIARLLADPRIRRQPGAAGNSNSA
jgi:hypothetical protein